MKLILSVWVCLQLTIVSRTHGQTTSLSGSITPPLPESTATKISTAQITDTQTISEFPTTQSIQNTRVISDISSMPLVYSSQDTSVISSVHGFSSDVLETSLLFPSTSYSDDPVSKSPEASSWTSTDLVLTSTTFPATLQVSPTHALDIGVSNDGTLSLTSSTHTLNVTETSSSFEIKINSSRETITDSVDSLQTISPTTVKYSINSTIYSDSGEFSLNVTSISLVPTAFTPVQTSFTDSTTMHMTSSDKSELIQTTSVTSTSISVLHDSSEFSIETIFLGVSTLFSVKTIAQSSVYMESSSILDKHRSASDGTGRTSETLVTVKITQTSDGVVSTSFPDQNSIIIVDSAVQRTLVSSISSVSVQNVNTNSNSVVMYSLPDDSETMKQSSMISSSVVSQSPKSNDIHSASTVDQLHISSSVHSDSRVEQTVISDRMSTVEIHSSLTSQSTASDHRMTKNTISVPASHAFKTSVLLTRLSTDTIDSFSSISVIAPSITYSSFVYSSKNVTKESFSTNNVESNATQLLTPSHTQTLSHEIKVSILTITSTPSFIPVMTVSYEKTVHSVLASYSGSYVSSLISSSENTETHIDSNHYFVSTVPGQTSTLVSDINTQHSQKPSSGLPNSLSTVFATIDSASSADHVQSSKYISTQSDKINSSRFSPSSSTTMLYSTRLATVSVIEQLETSLSQGSAPIPSVTATTNSQSSVEITPSLTSIKTSISLASIMLSTISSQPVSLVFSQLTMFSEIYISSLSVSSISEIIQPTKTIALSTDSTLLFISSTTSTHPESLPASAVSIDIHSSEMVTTYSKFSSRYTPSLQLTISTFSESDMVHLTSSVIGTSTIHSTSGNSPLSTTSDFITETVFTESLNSAFDSISMELSTVGSGSTQTSIVPIIHSLISSSTENSLLSDLPSSHYSSSRKESSSSLISDQYHTTTATGSLPVYPDTSTEIKSHSTISTSSSYVTTSRYLELSSRLVDEVSVSNTIISFGSYSQYYSTSMSSFPSRESASLFTSFSEDSLSSFTSHETIYQSSMISISTRTHSFNESSVMRVTASSGTIFQPDVNMTVDSIREGNSITVTSMPIMSSIESVRHTLWPQFDSDSTLQSTLSPSTNDGYLKSESSMSTVFMEPTKSMETDTLSLLTGHILSTLTSTSFSYESSFKITSVSRTPAFNSISTSSLSSVIFDKSSSVNVNVSFSVSREVSHITATQVLDHENTGIETLTISSSDIILSLSESILAGSQTLLNTNITHTPDITAISLEGKFSSALTSFYDNTKSNSSVTNVQTTSGVWTVYNSNHPSTRPSLSNSVYSVSAFSKISPSTTLTLPKSSSNVAILTSFSTAEELSLDDSKLLVETTSSKYAGFEISPTKAIVSFTSIKFQTLTTIISISYETSLMTASLSPTTTEISSDRRSEIFSVTRSISEDSDILSSSSLRSTVLVDTTFIGSKSELTISLFSDSLLTSSSVEMPSLRDNLYPTSTINESIRTYINTETPSVSVKLSSSMTVDSFSSFVIASDTPEITSKSIQSSTDSLYGTPMSMSVFDFSMTHSLSFDELTSTKTSVSFSSFAVVSPSKVLKTSSVLIGNSLISGSDRVSETQTSSISTNFATSREQISTLTLITAVNSGSYVSGPGVISSASFSELKLLSTNLDSNLKSEHSFTTLQSFPVMSKISVFYHTEVPSVRPSITSSILSSMSFSSKDLVSPTLGMVKSSIDVASSINLSTNNHISTTNSISIVEDSSSTFLTFVIDPTKPIDTETLSSPTIHEFQTRTTIKSGLYEPVFTITSVSSFHRRAVTFSNTASHSPSTNLYSSYADSVFTGPSISSTIDSLNSIKSNDVTGHLTESRSVNESPNLSFATNIFNSSVSVDKSSITVSKSEVSVSLFSDSLLSLSLLASSFSYKNIYPASTIIESTGTRIRTETATGVRFFSSTTVPLGVNMTVDSFSSFVTASDTREITSMSIQSLTDSLHGTPMSMSVFDLSMTHSLSFDRLTSTKTSVSYSSFTVVSPTKVLNTSGVLIGTLLISGSDRVSETQTSLISTNFATSREQISTLTLITAVSSESYVSGPGVISSASFIETKLLSTNLDSNLKSEHSFTPLQSFSVMSKISVFYHTEVPSLRPSITSSILSSMSFSSKDLVSPTLGMVKSSIDVASLINLSTNNHISTTNSISIVEDSSSTFLTFVIDPTKPIDTETLSSPTSIEFQTRTTIKSGSYEPVFIITSVSSFHRRAVTFSNTASHSPSTNLYSSYADSVFTGPSISSTIDSLNSRKSNDVTGHLTESRSVNESPNLSFATNIFNSPVSGDKPSITVSKSEVSVSLFSDSLLSLSLLASSFSYKNIYPASTIIESTGTRIRTETATGVRFFSSTTVPLGVNMTVDSFSSFVTASDTREITSMSIQSLTDSLHGTPMSMSVFDLSMTHSLSFDRLTSTKTSVSYSSFTVVSPTKVLNTSGVLIGTLLISGSDRVSETQTSLISTNFATSREQISTLTLITAVNSESYVSGPGVISSKSISETKLLSTSLDSSPKSKHSFTPFLSFSVMSKLSSFYHTKVPSAASISVSTNNQLSSATSISIVEGSLLTSTFVTEPSKHINTWTSSSPSLHEFQTRTLINSLYEQVFTTTSVSSFHRSSVTLSNTVSHSPSTNLYSSYTDSVFTSPSISSTIASLNTITSNVITGYFIESRSVNESPILSFATNIFKSSVLVDTSSNTVSKSEVSVSVFSDSLFSLSSIKSLSSLENIYPASTIVKSTGTSIGTETSPIDVRFSSSASLPPNLNMTNNSFSSLVTAKSSLRITSILSSTVSLQRTTISNSVLSFSLTPSLSSTLSMTLPGTRTSLSLSSSKSVILPVYSTEVLTISSVLIDNSVTPDSDLVSYTQIPNISTRLSESGAPVSTQRLSTVVSSNDNVSAPVERPSTTSTKLDTISTSSKDLLRTTLSLVQPSSGISALTSVSIDKQLSLSELTSSFEASPPTPSALFSESSFPPASLTSVPSTLTYTTDLQFTEMTISNSLSTINTQVLTGTFLSKTLRTTDVSFTSVVDSRMVESASAISSLDTSQRIMTETSFSSIKQTMLTTTEQSILASSSELAVTQTERFISTSSSFYTQDTTITSESMTSHTLDTSSTRVFDSESMVTASPFLSLETSSKPTATMISSSIPSATSIFTALSVSSDGIIATRTTVMSAYYSTLHSKDLTETKSEQTSVIAATSSFNSGLVETTSYMPSLETPSQTTTATTFSSKLVHTTVSESKVIPSIKSSVVVASSFTTMRTVTLQPSSDTSIYSANLTSTLSVLENVTTNTTQLLTTVSSSVLDLPSVNVTITPTSMAVSSTFIMSNTSVAPTTNAPPEGTTMNATASEEPYWVRTVLKIRNDVSITSANFKADLEKRLAMAYDVAFTREKLLKAGKFEPLRRRRKKRYTAVGDAAVHLHEVSRDPGTTSVSAVYSVEKSGQVLTAADAVAALDLLDTQEVAIILQQVLQTKAETYIQSEIPQETDDGGSKLWLIAAILGPVVAFVIFIWIVLCIYYKWCRQKPTEYDEPRLMAIHESPRRVKDLSSVQEPRPLPDKQLPRQSSKSSLKPKVRAYEVTTPKEPDVISEEYKSQGAPATPSRGPVPDKSVQKGGVNKSPPGNSLAPPKQKRGKRNRRNSIEPLAQNPVLEAVPQTGQPDEKKQLLHSSLSDDNEELQERARIERRRNKDRLRERRRKERGDDPRVSEYVTSQNHLNNLGMPSTSLPSVYVESGSPVKEPTISRQDSGVYNGHVSAEENLEEARSRMHSLLDQAFSLISPRASLTESDVSEIQKFRDIAERHKKQLASMSSVSQRGSEVKPDSGHGSKMSVAQDLERGKDIKHEPMHVNTMHSTTYSDFPLETWSPYRASDQVALISMPQRLEPEPIRLGQKKSENRPASSKPGRRPAANFDFSESKSTSALTDAKYTTSPAKPIVLKTKDNKPDSGNANGTKSNRQFSATGINGDVYLTGSTTSLSAPKSKPNTENMEMKTYQNSSAKKHKAPSKDIRNNDEVDVVNSLKPGETSDNLFQSLRDELSMLKESYKPETKPGRRRRSSTRPMTEIV